MKFDQSKLLSNSILKSHDGIKTITLAPTIDLAALSKNKHNLRLAQSALRTLQSNIESLDASDLTAIKKILLSSLPIILQEIESVVSVYKQLEPELKPVNPSEVMLTRKRAADAQHE